MQTQKNLNVGLELEKVEHGFHVDEGLFGLPVDRPEKVQGDGELEEQPVDHH